MSNMIRTPIDLTGEQKTILAVISMRQLYIIFPVAMLSLLNLLAINYPFIGGVAEFLIKLFILIVANGISCALAFLKLHKYDCYLSTFIIRRIKFWKSKKIYSI